MRASSAAEPDLVGKQLDAVLEDIGADAVKTGMLANAPIVEVVASHLRNYALVVDPVLVSSSGHLLLDAAGIEALKRQLIPLALVVTPNIPEAVALTARRDPREAARALHDLGARNVIVKGGHAESSDSDDLLYDGHGFHVFHAERVNTSHTHGTGCAFSAAIAAGLAKGQSLPEATEQAKRYITAALQQAVAIGQGTSPVNHFPTQW